MRAISGLFKKSLFLFFRLFHNGVNLEEKTKKNNHWSKSDPPEAENFRIKNRWITALSANHEQKAKYNDYKSDHQ